MRKMTLYAFAASSLPSAVELLALGDFVLDESPTSGKFVLSCQHRSSVYVSLFLRRSPVPTGQHNHALVQTKSDGHLVSSRVISGK